MKVRLKNGEVCILQSSGERVVSYDAVATCNAVFFVYPYESVNNYSPQVNKTAHPIWSDLYCKSVAIKKHGKGAIITTQYEGVDFNWDNNNSDENTVEVACTMREEAIETHPQFKTWAGTPKKPNAGIFDDDGKFTGWNANESLGEEMQGIKSYLVPSYSGTISYVSRGRPSLGGIGKIGGGNGLPSIGGKYQWMNTGVSFATMADGKYRVTESYLLSGPNGWNRKIYS